MRKNSHIYSILKKIYSSNKKLTATDFNCSNANQYLVELEAKGLIIREWKQKGGTRAKFAFVSHEMKEKVLAFLNKKKAGRNENQTF